VVKELKPWNKHHTKIILAKDTKHGDRIVAVKAMNLAKASSSKRSKLIDEMEMLKLVKGQKNIIELLDVIQTENRIFLIMEYFPTDLLRYIRDHGVFSEAKAWQLFHQLVDAVKYLHDRSIFHANLKLENILYDEKSENIKLIDFGSAKKIDRREKNVSSFSNPGYIAPEVWLNHEFGFDGPKNDIYGLGVILYAILFGRLPFDDTKGFLYYPRLKESKVVRKRPDLKFDKHVPKKLQRFLHGLMALDPQHRYSLNKIAYSSWYFYNPTELKEMKKEMKTQREALRKEDSSHRRRNTLVDGVKKVSNLIGSPDDRNWQQTTTKNS